MKLNLLKKATFLAAAALAAGCMFSSLPVHALDVSGKVPVTYEAEGDITKAHLVTVYASGDGVITAGDITIRNTSEGFYLPVGETKTLKLVPDSGANVEKVVVNGKTTQLDLPTQDTIEVVGVEEAQTITVEFSQTADGGTKTDPSKTDAPQTGDAAQLTLYVGVAVLALIGLFVTFAKKKTSKNQDDNQ